MSDRTPTEHDQGLSQQLNQDTALSSEIPPEAGSSVAMETNILTEIIARDNQASGQECTQKTDNTSSPIDRYTLNPLHGEATHGEHCSPSHLQESRLIDLNPSSSPHQDIRLPTSITTSVSEQELPLAAVEHSQHPAPNQEHPPQEHIPSLMCESGVLQEPVEMPPNHGRLAVDPHVDSNLTMDYTSGHAESGAAGDISMEESGCLQSSAPSTSSTCREGGHPEEYVHGSSYQPAEGPLQSGMDVYGGSGHQQYDFTETDVENTSGYGAGLQHTELSQNTASSSEAAGNDCTVTLTPKRLKERLIDFKQKVGPLATSCGRRCEGELLAKCDKEFAQTQENYLRGCKWSPDGAMLMTASNDNIVRMFHIPDQVFTHQWDVHTELESTVKVAESDLIYDYCWFPGMTSGDPNTCLFATSVRDIPIHLFSAVTGKLVCSYRPYNQVDEIVAAHSIGFSSDGKYLVAGFNKTLRCFDTNRPGRECVTIPTISKEKDFRGNVVSVQGQRGILSCFAAHPTMPSLVAAGAFSGDVAIYDVTKGAMTAMFEGQSGGVTHVVFSKDGNYLFAGGRKDPEINCFDIRNPERVLYVLYRYVATNQRMYFDLDTSSQYLLSGHHNGKVTVWDLKGSPHSNDYTPWAQLDPISHFTAHLDTVNGCSVNPHHPVLATSSGQRHFSIDIIDDEEDAEIEENTVKLWNLRLP